MARTVPATATKASGQLITGALWNAGPKAAGDFLLNPPIFRGHQSSTQTITSGVYTVMALDVTDIDSENGHSNVTNNSRYTCQVPGWYWVEGYTAMGAGGSVASFLAVLTKNGSFIQGTEQFVQKLNDLQAVSCTALVQLAVGDYVEVKCQQSSGASLLTFAGGDLNPCMNVFWVSK